METTRPQDDISIFLATKRLVGGPKPSGRNIFDPKQKRLVGIALEAAIKRAKYRAIGKDVAFDIDLDWALERARQQKFKCCLTGIPFFLEYEGNPLRPAPFAPSLDRVDSFGGYTMSNVRIVVYAMNIMLMDWGLDVFERVMDGYQYIRAINARAESSAPRRQVRTAREKS